jgi:hypothetical protein
MQFKKFTHILKVLFDIYTKVMLNKIQYLDIAILGDSFECHRCIPIELEHDIFMSSFVELLLYSQYDSWCHCETRRSE